MRCLWLTRVDPEPETNGEFIYSGRLIGALAAAGADITVMCQTRPDGGRNGYRRSNDVRWSLVPDTPRPGWQSVFSYLPNMACRSATPAMRRRLDEMLAWQRWDAVVLDGLSVGWAIEPLLRRYVGANCARPRLIHISHNHEETTRANVARNYPSRSVKKALMLADAAKARRLERTIAGSVDLLTAITSEDATLFAAHRGVRPTLVLPPGYGGRRLPRRYITTSTPRRAIVVGSFDWVAKQMNLAEFATAAAPVLARAGIEIHVVGGGGEAFLAELRRRFPNVAIAGAVESIYPYMDRARIGVVPERSGGGFKLKVLDYVFNRLPIAALENSFSGIPLRRSESILAYPDCVAIAQGVVRAIDDLDLLNGLHERAYTTCAERFDWQNRGETLLDAVRAV